MERSQKRMKVSVIMTLHRLCTVLLDDALVLKIFLLAPDQMLWSSFTWVCSLHDEKRNI